MVKQFDFFVDMQASDAWAHMNPAERRKAQEVMGEMRDVYDFFFYGEK
jgi:hypothetical protein